MKRVAAAAGSLGFAILFFGSALGHATLVPEPAPAPAPRTVPAAEMELVTVERQLVTLTNHARKRRHLGPELVVDPILSLAALEHSREMKRLNYFDHRSPDPRNRTLVDRYRRSAVELEHSLPEAYSVGENLYFRESGVRFPGGELSPEHLAVEAQVGFLHSQEHRENLLRKKWRRIGVGAIEGEGPAGKRVWYVTVMFRN